MRTHAEGNYPPPTGSTMTSALHTTKPRALSRYQLVLIARAAAVTEDTSGGNPDRAARFRQFADVAEDTAPSYLTPRDLGEFSTLAQGAIVDFGERFGDDTPLPPAFQDLLDATPSVAELRHRTMLAMQQAIIGGGA